MRPNRHSARRPAVLTTAGFTLMELMIVVAIIGIITAIAVVQLRQTPIKAKEAVLKQDLFALRDVIDQYFVDKGKYPDSLDTLVDDGYLRKLPVDPFTKSSDTWTTESAEATEDDPTAGGGIIDVHSGSSDTALDGSQYSEW